MDSLVCDSGVINIHIKRSLLNTGLGQMGHGMAKNLREKIPDNSILVIYDINTTVLEQFRDTHGNGRNVRIASSPKEVASVSDIVLTSVPQGRHVEQVFLDANTGLLSSQANSGRNILFIELSTIDAAVSHRISEEVALRGFGDFVDAPCSVGSKIRFPMF
jgi:3-hydroxyisobutyrate dehydrogenase-like beta-hydroxyacid dehydrogenase